jgi:hypothetical protein
MTETLNRYDRAAYEMIIDNLKKENKEAVDLHRKVAKLENRLQAIDNYDKVVRAAIESDDNLKNAWDNFQINYTMVMGDPLLRRARDKVYHAEREQTHICKVCHQPSSSAFSRWSATQ